MTVVQDNSDSGDTHAGEEAPRSEQVIGEPVIAAIAAHAASTVTGVVRLEPGLLGLLGSMARTMRQHVTGLDAAPAEGVRVSVAQDGRSVAVDVDLVTSGQGQVAAVAHAVQHAVSAAIADATGLAVSSVLVSVLDIDGVGMGVW